MKYLTFYLLLVTVFLACSAQTGARIADASRPYLGWKIHFVKVDDETTSPPQAVMYQRLELKDALSDFYRDHPGEGYRIRCIAEDFDSICIKRQY